VGDQLDDVLASTHDDTRPFPIQAGWHKGDRRGRYKGSTIPWWLAEEAYKVYSAHFGNDQSLERLAERGGFGREELLWLLRDEIP
jgi:hypothetical protein